ncbi:hypothetical protein JCM5353_008315 [Sporobolomyces roseus]
MFTIRNARNALNHLRRGSESQGYSTVAGSTTIESEPTPHSKKQGKVHAGIWVIVGFVLSSLLSAGVVHHTVRGNSIVREGLSTAETCDTIAKFEEAGGVRLGPTESSLAGVGKGGVPGPRELLAHQAPNSSIYDNLQPDLRYLTADSLTGEVGQFLSAISLLHLGRETQRISIIPSIWRDKDHYGSSQVRMSELFDMERFRQDTGTLFVEWSDAKIFDSSWFGEKDEIGCYFSWNGWTHGASFADYGVSTTAWSVERPYGFASNSIEGHILFDYDIPTRRRLTQEVAKSTNRKIPKNMESNQLMCYTNIWALSRAGTSAPETFWNRDYKDFDGLQEKGGMIKLLHPSLRGTHPEWWSVGRFIDFSLAVWEVAILAVQRTLELETLPSSIVTVHVRRGDFASWCPSGHGCVAPLDTYKVEVDELLKVLPNDTIVLVTTDETSSEFHSSLKSLGWYAVNHAAVGTAALLKERHGDASGWWDSAVDQAILSLGKGFVGTLDSQVSLVSALRIASWNDGETRFVKRPQ